MTSVVTAICAGSRGAFGLSQVLGGPARKKTGGEGGI